MVRPLQSVCLRPPSPFPPPNNPSPNKTNTPFPSLAPKYEELAELYTSNPTYNSQVVIAKVDATANDVPDEISGFPTIKLFPAGSKDAPITYSGSRTIEDLASFVKENGKFKVDVYEGKNTTEEGAVEGDDDDNDAGVVGKAAEAATEKVKDAAKEAAAEATEAAKTVVAGDGDSEGQEHDEL